MALDSRPLGAFANRACCNSFSVVLPYGHGPGTLSSYRSFDVLAFISLSRRPVPSLAESASDGAASASTTVIEPSPVFTPPSHLLGSPHNMSISQNTRGYYFKMRNHHIFGGRETHKINLYQAVWGALSRPALPCTYGLMKTPNTAPFKDHGTSLRCPRMSWSTATLEHFPKFKNLDTGPNVNAMAGTLPSLRANSEE
ncbi:hypothetical protein EDB19DRAFT_1828837 [Suillus lakei]|nr:hypothetical protein EDB19DRAFT_1828837 [Suillus lakei]